MHSGEMGDVLLSEGADIADVDVLYDNPHFPDNNMNLADMAGDVPAMGYNLTLPFTDIFEDSAGLVGQGIGGTSAVMVRENDSADMVSVEEEGNNARSTSSSHDGDDVIVSMTVAGGKSGVGKRVRERGESASGASVTHDDDGGVVSNGSGSDFGDTAKRACRPEMDTVSVLADEEGMNALMGVHNHSGPNLT